MKILVCGMPRSMTTWIFNVIYALMKDPPTTWWIAPGSTEELKFIESSDLNLAKCHHYSESLANSADLIIYSYRDIRMSAISYLRKFSTACNRNQLDAWVLSGEKWKSVAACTFKYEWTHEHSIAAIARIRHELLAKGVAVKNSTDEDIQASVDGLFADSDSVTEISYNETTMILPNHRTYSPDVSNFSEKESELYFKIQSDFSIWLSNHGYLQEIDHGQEIEYHIATFYLANIEAPLVFDVGVERGSFTDLAVQAGAVKVHAFEPLPRHLKYLREKFSEKSEVKIIPVAVSNASGTADLHVATDLFGNELDFHHTLSDLGDSGTINRTKKVIKVQKTSLNDYCKLEEINKKIDLLKIDTDGHDLQVLHGLGDIRPAAIIAEYWDNLPATSGRNIYTLADMSNWANEHGYSRNIVIRRNGRIQEICFNTSWSVDGDWGNVIFFHNSSNIDELLSFSEKLAKNCHLNNLKYTNELAKDCEEKEAVIRQLDNALREIRQDNGEILILRKSLEEKEVVIRQLDSALQEIRQESEQLVKLKKSLEDKEKVIQELKLAYDSTLQALNARSI